MYTDNTEGFVLEKLPNYISCPVLAEEWILVAPVISKSASDYKVDSSDLQTQQEGKRNQSMKTPAQSLLGS